MDKKDLIATVKGLRELGLHVAAERMETLEQEIEALRAERDESRQTATRNREYAVNAKARAEAAETELEALREANANMLARENGYYVRMEAAEAGVARLEAALQEILAEHANDNLRPKAFYIASTAMSGDHLENPK